MTDAQSRHSDSRAADVDRRRFLKVAGAAAAGLAVPGLVGASSRRAMAGSSRKVSLSALFMKQAGYSEDDVRSITAAFMRENPDVEVRASFVAYEELHDKIVVAAAAGASTYDVVLVDCIWPPEFVEAGWLLDVTDRLTSKERAGIFPEVLSAVEYKGRLYGMPWLNDWEYLYYNKAMLAKAGIANPPRTWDEVAEQCRTLKRKGIVANPFIEQLAQTELLMCSYVNVVHGMGGALFDDEQNPLFHTGAGLEAVEYFKRMLDEGLYGQSSLESGSEEVRRTFSQGMAAFTVNWTYQWSMANDPAESRVAGDVGITLIPGSARRRSASVNGGMGLSIMKSSRHPDEAWEYVRYLAGTDVQKRYAANALPIWRALYEDAELVKSQPVLVPLAKEQARYVVNRPQVPWYSQASQILQEEIHSALTGMDAPKVALERATKRIEAVKKGRR